MMLRDFHGTADGTSAGRKGLMRQTFSVFRGGLAEFSHGCYRLENIVADDFTGKIPGRKDAGLHWYMPLTGRRQNRIAESLTCAQKCFSGESNPRGRANVHRVLTRTSSSFSCSPHPLPPPVPPGNSRSARPSAVARGAGHTAHPAPRSSRRSPAPLPSPPTVPES